MADNKGVMILGEVIEGNLSSISTELLGCGRKLADELGQELSALLIGGEVSGCAQEAIAFGADKVYVVEDSLLGDYQADSYVTAAEKAAKETNPAILLLGQTEVGSDIAARLAFRLETAAVLDCIALEIDPDSKRLLQTKPVYGGNAQAIYMTDTDPQIATVRVKSMTPLAKDDSRQGEIVDIDAGLDASAIRTKVLEKVKEEVEGVKLEDAAVIVTGGRGIGGEEGFKELEELA
ncbi:MAG: electron transfer flavoprotein subunit alpha/FixB family protein, partial [Dehalococcoidales bacterium]